MGFRKNIEKEICIPESYIIHFINKFVLPPAVMSKRSYSDMVSCILKSLSTSGIWSKSTGGCTIGLNNSYPFLFGGMAVFYKVLNLDYFLNLQVNYKKKGMGRIGNLERENRKGMNRKRDPRRWISAKSREVQLFATLLLFFCVCSSKPSPSPVRKR